VELADASVDIAGIGVDDYDESRDRLGGSLPVFSDGFGVSFSHPLFSATSAGRERLGVDFVRVEFEPLEVAVGEALMTPILSEDNHPRRLSHSSIHGRLTQQE
jgi:hypothetical protein